jgi:GAF domain-containing protein
MQDSRAVTIEGTEDIAEEHLMAAPIVTQNTLNGLLVVWRIGLGEEFTQTEFEFLRSLAQQAAIAVENARLFEETQERAEELAVLNDMARDLSAEMNINAIAETANRYVNRLIETTNFFIALLDERKDQVSFPIFIEKNQRISVPPSRSEKGLTEFIIKTKEPLFIPNNFRERIKSLRLKEILPKNKEIPSCWLGVPLLVGNRAVGAMVVCSFDAPDLFIEHDKDLLTTIASQVAIALENARLFKDAQSRARREKILREITAHIRATNDPEMIAKAAVRELGQALGVSTFIRLGGSETLSKQEEIQPGKLKKKDKKSGPTIKSKNAVKGGI